MARSAGQVWDLPVWQACAATLLLLCSVAVRVAVTVAAVIMCKRLSRSRKSAPSCFLATKAPIVGNHAFAGLRRQASVCQHYRVDALETAELVGVATHGIAGFRETSRLPGLLWTKACSTVGAGKLTSVMIQWSTHGQLASYKERGAAAM